MIIVIINECPRQPRHVKWAGLFEARVDGRLVCAKSRTPFLDTGQGAAGRGM
jgi:hypothetical protein